MKTEIELMFDGETPGLAHGRLSLGEFMPAFGKLVTALRRIGSNIVVNAMGDPAHGGKGGRFHRKAEVLDLEIDRLDHNCLLINAIATAHARPGENLELFDDLASRAGEELFSALRDESNGRARQVVVRDYLRALPKGLLRQRYRLLVDGSVRSVVEIDGTRSIEDPPVLPGLSEFVCTPSGVVFDAKQPQVRLNDPENGQKWFLATASHVHTVLANRDSEVRVLVLNGGGSQPRVLRLAVGTDPLPSVAADVRERRLFVDWDGVLRRLA